MKSQITNKGFTLLLLLVVASAITALGVFLDGEVIPPQPETEALLKDTATQSALSRRRTDTEAPSEPTEVSKQLERAIEAANQSEADTTEGLEENLATSKTLIEQTNRLLVEIGVTSKRGSSSERSQQFNQQLNDLESRLRQLKSSE